ncbi:hypothetical protein [Pseudolactococcus reticulitermitis]|uniref:Uncharacterized protein n=1 Tax=Pseudolactococcus reticulitermitis TaxID=2025039 RepID=A0A224X1E6_9LACT|nr:hypothetical protein [Lactococcus reticulitermitis]GAX48007.1 hypothetical protein RsY01_1621 [Lactococcus reticulitermitis]
MKKVFKAYFKLRKGWLITLYALLLLGGLASMVNDGVQWRKWETAVTQYTNEKDYQKFRTYYQENPDMDVYANMLPESKRMYLNLTPINSKFYKVDRIKGHMIYESAPADYQTFKKDLLRYYPAPKYLYTSQDYRNISGAGRDDKNVFVKFNLIALMDLNILLIFVGAFALAIVLDQSKNVTAFIGARIGGISKVHVVQFIYWTGIPLVMASILSLITHLTRQFFIPIQYVTISGERILQVSGESLSVALIAAIGVSLINALVGKPVYKIMTGVLAVPALAMGIANLRQLITYRPISDILVKTPSFVYLLVFAVIAIPIILILQKRQSLEQDSFYIKLKALRLPFYIGVVILTILDFVLPFFMMGRVMEAPLDVVINLVMIAGVFTVFAKLILDKDVRDFLKN